MHGMRLMSNTLDDQLHTQAVESQANSAVGTEASDVVRSCTVAAASNTFVANVNYLLVITLTQIRGEDSS